MYIYAPLKKKTFPTIAEARKALEAADNDDATKKDVRDLMSILMRMIEASPRLAGHILTRRTAVSSFSWSIIPSDSAFDDAAHAAMIRLRNIITSELNKHTDVPMFGVSATELDWVPQVDGSKKPMVLKSYLPIELERNTSDPRTINIYQDEIVNGKPTGKFVKVPIGDQPPESWLVDCDESYVPGGVLRSLIPHAIISLDMMMEWANFNKKIKGLILAQYEEHAQDQEKLVALEALKKIVTNNFALTSKDISFDFKNVVDSVGATSFSQQIGKIEDDESIAILGQANVTQLPDGGGSRAAVQVQNLVRADIYYSDISRFERRTNEQLLLADYRINVDPAAVEVPWRFAFALSEEKDAEKEARTIAELLQAGIPLKRDEVYERVGFSAPEATDEIIQPAAPTQPMV
jgi:phage gp29-like protein